jgi:lysophospholipase L1-like esterase
MVAAGAVAVVAIVVVALVISRRTPPEGTKVLIAGDSVTYLAADALVERFEWTDNLIVRGYPGYRTDQVLHNAETTYAESEPPIVVAMTGYNDLTQGVDTDQAVQEMMQLLGGADCAVWLLIPTKGAIEAERVEAFNERAEELADDAGVHVARGWRDAADDTEGPEPDPELVAPDGIHQTDAGSEVIADVMAEAVEEECSGVGR